MNPTRLPAGTAPRSRSADVAVALSAIVGLAIVVVGVPIGLWLLAGKPWAPAVDESVLSEASARDVVAVLVIVLWLVWAYFVLCLVVEAVAEARGGRIAPQLLGGGAGTQALARRSVAAVVLIGGTSTAPVAALQAASMPVDPSGMAEVMPDATIAATPSPSTDTSPRTTGEYVPVEARTGDGAAPYYDVRPQEGRNYETLWDIADRFLGSGSRYKEIFELNRGVVQPDGSTMTTTDLIKAGWVLRLPADAQGAGLRVVDHSLDSLQSAPAAEPAGGSADESDQQSGGGWAPLFGVAGGLVAAGLAAGLRRLRAGATVGALSARRLDPPPNGNAARTPEASLRNEAAESVAAILDRGLRAWTNGGTPGIPPIAQCSVSSTNVVVSFHGVPGTQPPTGWKALRDGHIWSLAVDDAGRLPDGGAAPAPALVALGRRDDGSTLLADLDGFRGLVCIGGDSGRARSVAMSFALDMATHAWADQRQVTMVGFADDIAAVAEDTFRVVDDLAQAIDPIERFAAEQRQACSRIGVRSVHEARFSHPDSTLWQPQLVVCSGIPTQESLAALHDLAADVRASVSVVIVGDVPNAAARFVASDDGRITCPPLGIDVTAQGIDVDAYRGIVDLYRRASAEPADPEGPEALAPLIDVTEVEPALFDAGTRQPVEVRVLGPVRVEGASQISESRRDLLTEIAAYVALQPGGVHIDALTAAIWPRGVVDAKRDAELERVAGWLGKERFVESDGLWRLQGPGLRVDWDVFRAYVDHAERMPREAGRALSAALDLVTGEAWADLPAGRYAWLAYDAASVQIPALVIRTARRLAAMEAERGNADAARDALQRGLRMAPASEQLWCDALRLAAKHASPRDVKAIADQMYATIEAQGSPRGARPETDALVGELLPGYRRAA